MCMDANCSSNVYPKHTNITHAPMTTRVSCSRCKFCGHKFERRYAFKLRDGPIDWWFCDDICCASWVQYRHSSPAMHKLIASEPYMRVCDKSTTALILSHLYAIDDNSQVSDQRISWLRLLHNIGVSLPDNTIVPSTEILWKSHTRHAARHGREWVTASSASV